MARLVLIPLLIAFPLFAQPVDSQGPASNSQPPPLSSSIADSQSKASAGDTEARFKYDVCIGNGQEVTKNLEEAVT